MFVHATTGGVVDSVRSPLIETGRASITDAGAVCVSVRLPFGTVTGWLSVQTTAGAVCESVRLALGTVIVVEAFAVGTDVDSVSAPAGTVIATLAVVTAVGAVVFSFRLTAGGMIETPAVTATPGAVCVRTRSAFAGLMLVSKEAVATTTVGAVVDSVALPAAGLIAILFNTLNAPIRIAWAAPSDAVAVMLPVAPDTPLTASQIDSDPSDPVVKASSVRSCHVPTIGSAVWAAPAPLDVPGLVAECAVHVAS